MTPERRAQAVLDEYEGSSDVPMEAIADAIRAAVAEEREECAKIAENRPGGQHTNSHSDAIMMQTRHMVAAAIRARGEKA